MKDDVRTFILSLPGKTLRRESALREVRKYHLPFEFVDAVSASSLKDKENLQVTPQGKKRKCPLSLPEIACALGHQKIYGEIIAQNLSYSLIVEDDFEFIADPRPLLRHLEEIRQKTAFDVLILGYVKMRKEDLAYHYRRLPLKKIAAVGDYQFGYPWEQFSCGTVGYVITAAGAKKLQAGEITATADDWLSFTQNRGLRVIHCRPLVILERTDFVSAIRVEKPDYLKIKPTSYLVRSAKGIIKNWLMNYWGWK